MQILIVIFLALLAREANADPFEPMAAVIPTEVAEVIRRSCARTTLGYQGRIEIEEKLAHLNQKCCGTSRQFNISEPLFRRVIEDYLDDGEEQGKPPLFSMFEVYLTLDDYLDSIGSPFVLGRYLTNAEEVMNRLKLAAAKQNGVFAWEDLGIKTRSPKLHSLLENFARTKLKLHLLPVEEFLPILMTPIGETLVREFPIKWRTNLGTLAKVVESHVEEMLPSQGVYLPQNLPVGNGKTLDLGLYFPSHYNVPGLAETVAQQIAQATADGSWDLELLLYYFRRGIKPRLDKLGNRILQAELAKLFAGASSGFRLSTAYPRYRAFVEYSPNAGGLDKYDWLVFFEMVKLLTRFHSHDMSGLVASIRKKPRWHDHPLQVYRYVMDLHKADFARLKITAGTFFTHDEINSMVDLMESTPRDTAYFRSN